MIFSDYESVARNIVKSVGKHITIGVPLGLGKPIGVLNALYRLAEKDSSIELTIITALTLARPLLKNTLEKNFIEPILERILQDYEDPLYEVARVKQTLPKNINVIEFFLTPGRYLRNAYVQQHYTSSSYTNVVRDLAYYKINVIAQQVAHSHRDADLFSLSCNTDLFHATVEYLVAQRTAGLAVAIVGEVNNNLPFMFGQDAVVKTAVFTDIVDTGQYKALFALPREELSLQDHLIGLYTSTLIKDNGCIQIGIGKLSNAVANAIILRHQQNQFYQTICQQLKIESHGLDPFSQGLYASTEMFSDEYIQLYKAGILKKRVFDCDNKSSGKVMHAGFFLGSVDLYKQLNQLSDEERSLIDMTSIARTNALTWNPELLTKQRQDARFINTAMMVTLGGMVVSDGLANLQEVSGVGGQFDFIDMASKLPGARSIILCRSTRETRQGVMSNIVWNYGNVTIPRYLRDIIVTEYGIADCRSKTDAEVAKAILNITDSRFQEPLLKNAIKYGKLPSNYQIPSPFCHNYPENLNTKLDQSHGYFKAYPFGSDLTEDEIVIGNELKYLKNCTRGKLLWLFLCAFLHKVPAEVTPYLERMRIMRPKNFQGYCYKKLLSLLLSKKIGNKKAGTIECQG